MSFKKPKALRCFVVVWILVILATMAAGYILSNAINYIATYEILPCWQAWAAIFLITNLVIFWIDYRKQVI